VLDSRLGNHEKLALYAEALEKFTEAKQLPELFRSIFRSAYLPYKSPETLGLFLKEMNHFDYTHPEELGNAYEYLLSIMSSQGDAGQFRTPRHIIDFMVDVINPSKDDRILDPACGTGGFLISSYKHILEQHDGKNDPKKKEKPLTPDDRKKLMANLEGYDIDPTMVRIAQVNMYLHQFKNPQIFQYDTLTSEERWNDKYDVILANPPFMSPRGGIKPHNKFGVASNRSEVLFVDYIVSHLRPKGRAGIIVPEGIIFQSGVAYKALRKNLVENGLYAVVSLPGGVFQPYSGVKTSILLFNNELAKQKSEIAFIKISADGYDLGASKRVVSQNDLPLAVELLQNWSNGLVVDNPLLSFVSKEKIATNGNYNLSGESYKAGVDHSNVKWPIVKLGEICKSITPPKKIPSTLIKDFGKYQVIDQSQNPVAGWTDDETALVSPGRGLLIFGDHTCATKFVTQQFAQGADGIKILDFDDSCHPKYVYHFLQAVPIQSEGYKRHFAKFKEHSIPLPPLEIQEQIVAELDGYAAIISGAKQIVENWKPRIDVDSAWEARELGDVCEVYQPKTITGAEILDDGPYKVYGANGVIGFYDQFNHPEAEVAITCRGATCGTVNFTEPESWITGNAMVVSPKDKTISKKFLQYLLIGTNLNPVITGSAQPQITGASLKPFEISIPPIDEQERIVELINAEANQVDSAKKLIETYEARTQAVIARLWSE
jgi:type I restriction enzyme M protein